MHPGMALSLWAGPAGTLSTQRQNASCHASCHASSRASYPARRFSQSQQRHELPHRMLTLLTDCCGRQRHELPHRMLTLLTDCCGRQRHELPHRMLRSATPGHKPALTAAPATRAGCTDSAPCLGRGLALPSVPAAHNAAASPIRAAHDTPVPLRRAGQSTWGQLGSRTLVPGAALGARRAAGGGGEGRSLDGKRGRSVTVSSGKGFGAPEVQVDEEERRQGAGKGRGAGERPQEAPGDAAFEAKLAAVRKAAQEKKKSEGARMYSAIDYDNPEPVTLDTGFFTKDIGAKIGIGIAATVFAFIFAFGDILPPPDPPSNNTRNAGSLNGLSPQQRKELEAQLEIFEDTLKTSASDRTALEGAAVLSVELGNLARADELLGRLEQVAPGETEILRLHGEVLFSLQDFGGSTKVYRRAIQMAGAGEGPSIELLQGLTESLIADSKPKEAVDELLAAKKAVAQRGDAADTDPVQLDLLLGKAFSAWGRAGDAAGIYDGLISSRPNDFRGYLAKALLLQSQGKEGDSQRMFLQAKFLAPEGSKGLVDRLARNS